LLPRTRTRHTRPQREAREYPRRARVGLGVVWQGRAEAADVTPAQSMARKRKQGKAADIERKRRIKKPGTAALSIKHRKRASANEAHLAAIGSESEMVHAMATTGVSQAGSSQDLLQIIWPPMVCVDGLSAEEDSRTKLLRCYQTATHAFPVYAIHGFRRAAVLVFESGDDEHAAGYERAQAVAAAAGGTLATWADATRWSSQRWAWRLCERVVGWRKVRPSATADLPELMERLVRMRLLPS